MNVNDLVTKGTIVNWCMNCRPGYGKKANIPEWWPTDVPYQSFKMDPRTPEQKEKVNAQNWHVRQVFFTLSKEFF